MVIQAGRLVCGRGEAGEFRANDRPDASGAVCTVSGKVRGRLWGVRALALLASAGQAFRGAAEGRDWTKNYFAEDGFSVEIPGDWVRIPVVHIVALAGGATTRWVAAGATANRGFR